MYSFADTFAPTETDPADAAFQTAAEMAQREMQAYRRYKVRYLAADPYRDAIGRCAMYDLMQMQLGKVWGLMAPFRVRIGLRTDDERRYAEKKVREGWAGFVMVACEGESCDDCERPLWMHIRLKGWRLLCPFGREYWTYARAIDATGRGVDAADTRALCAMISTNGHW